MAPRCFSPSWTGGPSTRSDRSSSSTASSSSSPSCSSRRETPSAGASSSRSSRASSTSWWASRTRQFRAHLRANVTPEERAALVAWIAPAQLDLFDAMHVADRRHGLDVVASLREEGVTEPDLLVAGLLHDAGKGDTGVWPRVAYTLGSRYGDRITRVAKVLPGFGPALERLRTH